MSALGLDLDLDTLILHYGAHRTREEGLCAMEAEAWLAGEKHTDHPVCVCPVIAAFVRRWNDGFSDDAERTRHMMPLLRERVMTGTRSTPRVQRARAWLAVDWLLRMRMPALLRALGVDEEAAAQLEQLPGCTSRQTVATSCALLRDVATRARTRRDEARKRLGDGDSVTDACAVADACAVVHAYADDGAYADRAAVAAVAHDAAMVAYAAAAAADYASKAAHASPSSTAHEACAVVYAHAYAASEAATAFVEATHASAQDLVRRMAAVT